MNGVRPAGEAQVGNSDAHLGERAGTVLHAHLRAALEHPRADVALAELDDRVGTEPRDDLPCLGHRLLHRRHQVADVSSAQTLRNVGQRERIVVRAPGIDKIELETVYLQVAHRRGDAAVEELAPCRETRIPHVRAPGAPAEHHPVIVPEVPDIVRHQRHRIPENDFSARRVQPRHMRREITGVALAGQVLAVIERAAARHLPAVVYDDRVQPD